MMRVCLMVFGDGLGAEEGVFGICGGMEFDVHPYLLPSRHRSRHLET